jgi:hypothetical protein
MKLNKHSIFYVYFLFVFLILLLYLIHSNNEHFTDKKITLFNIDLHISVIEDFIFINKLINSNINIENNSISNHAHIMGKQLSDKYLTNNNWIGILNNKKELQSFYEKNKMDLEKYDGFVITHTPSFILLYEKFNKPIIIINSCRYENPFMNNLEKWKELNKVIQNMFNKKLLTIVSNNKADQKYFLMGNGINSIHIPSLCLYTKAKYKNKINKFVLFDRFNIIPDNKLFIKKENLKQNYSWEELYSYKGIIHIPYEISTMSIFEQYSANVPLFFPSKNFIKKLVKEKKIKLQSKYSNIYLPELEQPLGTNNYDFWINNADFYDKNNMKHIQYFDSVQHLLNLLVSTNTNKISKFMASHNKIREKNVKNEWNNIINNSIKLL